MKFTILAVDASTVSTGLATAVFDKGKLKRISLRTIAPGWTPAKSGFSPAVYVNPKGKKKRTYVRDGERITTLKQFNDRVTELRRLSEDYTQESFADGFSAVLKEVKPDVVVAEENMSFRSMRTTKVLGQVAGALKALCTEHGVPCKKINVHKARKKWEVEKRYKEFASRHTKTQLVKMKYPQKEILREVMFEKYGKYIDKAVWESNLDESDALVILDEYMEEDNNEYKNYLAHGCGIDNRG